MIWHSVRVLLLLHLIIAPLSAYDDKWELREREVHIADIYPKNCAYLEDSTPYFLTEEGDLRCLRSPKSELRKLLPGSVWTECSGKKGAVQLTDDFKDYLKSDLLLYNEGGDVLYADREDRVDTSRKYTLHGSWSLPTHLNVVLVDSLFCLPLAVEIEQEGLKQLAEI